MSAPDSLANSASLPSSNTVTASAVSGSDQSSSDDGFSTTLPYVLVVGAIAAVILIVVGIVVMNRRRCRRQPQTESTFGPESVLKEEENGEYEQEITPEREFEIWLQTEAGIEHLTRVGVGYEVCDAACMRQRRFTALSEGLLADSSLGIESGSRAASYDDVEEIYGRV